MINTGIYDASNPLMRQGLASILSGKPDISVAGTYSSPEQAIGAAKAGLISVLAVCIYSKLSEEIGLMRLLSSAYPKVRVLAISMDVSKDIVFESIKAGAKGHLTKNADASELVQSVYTIRNGYEYYDKSISDILLDSYVNHLKQEDKDTGQQLGKLSPRETEIVVMWGEGLSNKEIADKLFLSVRTIESHKNHIMQKLGLRTSVDLVKFAIKNNLVSL
jgi:DNA-binding NarL/FixJ family response regulator